ncbi:MAG: dimethyl sulfoxide reductase anchor subunit [Ignavibacteriales bacterium]|nr:dimethyl sulfoxide reductase anchor subunit [Ignavibacteriales bacterium]
MQVLLCPTGALDFGEMSGKPVVRVSGFVDKGMRPGIEIIPLRKSRPRSPVVQAQAADESGLFKRLLSTGPTKTGLKQEWPLIIFTILASLLFGFFAASVFKPIGVDPVAFLATGIIGMGLSAIHLGKKFRAWRAIVNVKTSWLSREIGACFLFLILCGLSVSVVHAESMRVAAMIAGLVMLISIDMVYSVAEGKPMPGLHSASVLVTGILFFSAFSQMMSLFVLVSGWKFILYGFEFVQASERSLPRTVLSILRIVAGFIVPLLLFGGPSGRTAAGVLLIVAELANRAEFYADLKILTPLRQVEKDLVRELG